MTDNLVERLRARAVVASYGVANVPNLYSEAADMLELVMDQRDALAIQLGIQPEWTSDDA